MAEPLCYLYDHGGAHFPVGNAAITTACANY
jgi:hypothetical protein